METNKYLVQLTMMIPILTANLTTRVKELELALETVHSKITRKK
jgi:hypothetical protein